MNVSDGHCIVLVSGTSNLQDLNFQEGLLQENREAVNQRLELSFEHSRNGETYAPEQARQLLAERSLTRNSE